MSSIECTKADIDALVTIALRWSQRGDAERMPAVVADVLWVTRDTATALGARLWNVNLEVARMHEALWEEAQEYRFEELPGAPAPETALRLVEFYESQTIRSGHYLAARRGHPPFEYLFAEAMAWWARVLLGLADPDCFRSEPVDLDPLRSIAYEQSGWGLDDGDRDLFLRVHSRYQASLDRWQPMLPPE